MNLFKFIKPNNKIKIFTGVFHMFFKPYIVKALQVIFHKGGDIVDRVLNTVKIIIQTVLSVFAQHMKQLVRLAACCISYEDRAEQCYEHDRRKHYAEHCDG